MTGVWYSSIGTLYCNGFLSTSRVLKLLEMAEENQLDRAVLALLDENITAATKSNEVHSAHGSS